MDVTLETWHGFLTEVTARARGCLSLKKVCHCLHKCELNFYHTDKNLK